MELVSSYGIFHRVYLDKQVSVVCLKMGGISPYCSEVQLWLSGEIKLNFGK